MTTPLVISIFVASISWLLASPQLPAEQVSDCLDRGKGLLEHLKPRGRGSLLERSRMKDKTFVQEMADRFGCDEHRAETRIFAVFQELRDLRPGVAADVAAQLPTSLKAL